MNRYATLLPALLAAHAMLAQGGPDCATALASPITLPFSAAGLTNCGSGNDYDAGTATICGSILYTGGEDQLYAFTPATSGIITIDLTSMSTFTGLFLYAGCPAGGTCVSSSYSGAGNQFVMAAVTAGVTYFIMVDSWPGPNCHPNYALDVSVPGALPPPTTQDCFGAIPVCQSSYQELTSPVGEGNYPDEIDGTASCLGGGEVDGLWYTYTVQASGNICFSITPNDLTDDYDWAVYDLTNANCSDIFSGVAPEVSCNFSGLSGITGANGLAGAQNEPCIPVNAGETYALYVSNWSQSTNGYTLDFGVPGSTANIFDLSPPTIDTVLAVDCSGTSLVLQMSEFVLCSSVQAADFTITGPGGPYTVTTVTSALCGTGGTQDNVFELAISPALAGGAYTIDLVSGITDLCGNIGSVGSVAFTAGSPLTLAVAVTGAGCNGIPGEVDAVASGGLAPITYDLSGTVQVNNGLFTGLAAGPYTLTVTDAGGCQVDTPLTVLSATTFVTNDSVVVDVTCFGGSDGSIEAVTSGNGGPWDYVWTNAGGTVVQTTNASSGDIFTGGAGTYTVVVEEGPLGSGCTDTLTATIMEPPQLVLSLSNDTLICIDGTATISASSIGGTTPVSLTWNAGLLGNGPHTVSPVVDQTYTVFATDMNGCTTPPQDIDVTVGDSLTVSLPDTLIGCPGVGVQVDVVTATGGDGIYQYNWGGGPGGSASTTITSNNSQQVCVILTDGCGTPAVGDCSWILIQPVPPVILSVDSTPGCAPFLTSFTVLDTTGAAVVDYTFGDGGSSTAGSTISHSYAAPGSYDVGATVAWPNGCVSDTLINDLVTVVSLPEPLFTWAPNPTSILESTITFEDLSGGAIAWWWYFAGLDSSTAQDPQFTFPNEFGDTYPVTLVVANALGCIDSITLNVIINDELLVFAPNAFSPNGDGLNEVFFVTGNDIDPDAYELTVFDRWGEVVFLTTDLFEPWLGTFQNGGGELMKDEVYVWKIRCRSAYNKKRMELFGSVTLLK